MTQILIQLLQASGNDLQLEANLYIMQKMLGMREKKMDVQIIE